MTEAWAAALAVSYAASVLLVWASFPVVRHGPQDKPEADDEEWARTFLVHERDDGWWVEFAGKDAVDEQFGPYSTEDEAVEHGVGGCT